MWDTCNIKGRIDELTNWVDGCWIVSGDLRISIRLAG